MKKIVILLPVFALIGLAVSFVYPRLVLNDFNNLCEAYEITFKAVDEGTLDPISAQIKIYEVADSFITPYAKRVFHGVNDASLSQRYELYIQSLEEHGHEGWTCDVMNRFSGKN